MTGKQIFVRTSMTIGLPFVLLWVFVHELCREIKASFWYARNAVQIELASYRKLMKQEDY